VLGLGEGQPATPMKRRDAPAIGFLLGQRRTQPFPLGGVVGDVAQPLGQLLTCHR